MTAWATASASLWPARPRSPSKRTPPSTSGRAGIVAEGVDVEALADPHGQRHRSSARLRSIGRGDLDVGRVAVHDHHPATGRLDQGGVVGALGLAGVGGAQGRGPEGLRRLHGHEPAAVDGAAADLAERVGHRDGGHGRVGARRRCAAQHPLPHARAPARPGGVVHEDHARRRRAPPPARPAPTPSGSRRRPRRRSPAAPARRPRRPARRARRRRRALGRRPQRPVEDARAAEGQVLLALAEPLAAARRPRRSPRWP